MPFILKMYPYIIIFSILFSFRSYFENWAVDHYHNASDDKYLIIYRYFHFYFAEYFGIPICMIVYILSFFYLLNFFLKPDKRKTFFYKITLFFGLLNIAFFSIFILVSFINYYSLPHLDALRLFNTNILWSYDNYLNFLSFIISGIYCSIILYFISNYLFLLNQSKYSVSIGNNGMYEWYN